MIERNKLIQGFLIRMLIMPTTAAYNIIAFRANLKMAHGSTNRQAFDRKLSQ